ncbi:hypothetical protein M0R45_006329 [Rubus argutus]|uniref:Uncharacterized protein n=1 Tax=Rubus argutus TaxID=59490 RepID=A0AAW1YQM5_RUBAR
MRRVAANLGRFGVAAGHDCSGKRGSSVVASTARPERGSSDAGYDGWACARMEHGLMVAAATVVRRAISRIGWAWARASLRMMSSLWDTASATPSETLAVELPWWSGAGGMTL